MKGKRLAAGTLTYPGHSAKGILVWSVLRANAALRQLGDPGAGRMSERKAVIKNADMAEDMSQDAIDCATQVRCRLQDA